jgi:hypothetical protein
MHQDRPSPGTWFFQHGPKLFYLVAHGWATSVEVFLRRDFGKRYLNLQAGMVFLLIPLFSVLFPGDDLRPLFWFQGAYLLMLLVARLNVAARSKQPGTPGHSRYSGVPRLMAAFPKWSEQSVKQYLEPALLWSVAAVIWYLGNKPLATYIAFGGFWIHAIVGDELLRSRRQAEQWNDMTMEQEGVAEQFREMRGEQW